ncbi:WhiB family transcriptional regulator [Kitasatospora sp. NPDC101155]|uniref:WhiB family transcriptional regulator n=1 Tax=Kitasatospora sp. NPDC101155 TaxID=3364097 RepID=UPI0038027814
MSAAALEAGPNDWAGLDEPMVDAACRYVDPELFFPDNRGGGTAAESRAIQAKSVCRACPARRECLRRAVQDGEQYGVWGGLTAPERRALRKQVQHFRNLPSGVPARIQHGDPVEVRIRDRPAVVALLARAGWSEQRICRALCLDPTAIRAALHTARQVLWVLDLVGGPTPVPLEPAEHLGVDPGRRADRAADRWRRMPGELPRAA